MKMRLRKKLFRYGLYVEHNWRASLDGEEFKMRKWMQGLCRKRSKA